MDTKSKVCLISDYHGKYVEKIFDYKNEFYKK